MHQAAPDEAAVFFHSEFGMLSLPQFETLQPVLNAAQGDYSIYSPVMLHRLHAGDELRNNLNPNFPADSLPLRDTTEACFRRVIYLTQVNQAESLRYTIDGGRLSLARNVLRPQGYCFWQLNGMPVCFRFLLIFLLVCVADYRAVFV